MSIDIQMSIGISFREKKPYMFYSSNLYRDRHINNIVLLHSYRYYFHVNVRIKSLCHGKALLLYLIHMIS